MPDIPHVEAMTAQEVAAILQVTRNTVYDLAKAGTLTSFNVGRKLRFTLDDVQAFIEVSRDSRKRQTTGADGAEETSGSAGPARARARRNDGQDGETITSNAFVIGGRDMILDSLADSLSAAGVEVLRSYQSSYEELTSLYRGAVHAAAIDLWDSSTDRYNLPYVKRLAPGTPVVVLHLATRAQGFLLKRNDPLGLRTWADLVHEPVVLANREKGSGPRVLLDEHLRMLEADPYAIRGYEREITSDLAQGTLIARGDADVGVATERVFHLIEGLDYRPLQREQLALVLAKTPATGRIIGTVRDVLRSEVFQRELAKSPGYDLTHIGAKLYET